jgi:hypothetical protein
MIAATPPSPDILDMTYRESERQEVLELAPLEWTQSRFAYGKILSWMT